MTEELTPSTAPDQAALARELGFFYQGGPWVFKNLSFPIKRSKVLAVLGPNGCGKTTFLKLLLGLLKPSSGSLSRNGQISFVPQLFQVVFAYSALDMVLMGRAQKIGLFSKPGRRDIELALAAMDQLQVAGLAGRSFSELSGGQRQLVMLARALVAEADILVLDEPTSALDLGNQSLLLKWIDRLSRDQGLTVVFSTHLPYHALAVADEALLMLGESKYYLGATNDVLSEDNLSEMYGVPLKRVRLEHDGSSREALVPILK